MTTEKIEIIKQVYAAFARNDLVGLLALVDPDCVVTQDASQPWGDDIGYPGLRRGAAWLRVFAPGAGTTPQSGARALADRGGI